MCVFFASFHLSFCSASPQLIHIYFYIIRFECKRYERSINNGLYLCLRKQHTKRTKTLSVFFIFFVCVAVCFVSTPGSLLIFYYVLSRIRSLLSMPFTQTNCKCERILTFQLFALFRVFIIVFSHLTCITIFSTLFFCGGSHIYCLHFAHFHTDAHKWYFFCHGWFFKAITLYRRGI